MKIPKAVSALSSIDDDLIIGAETFRRPKKTVIKWAAAAAAAVICLVLGISIPLATRTGTEEAIRSGLETVKNPVYDVVVYTAPETYEASRLYAATTPDLAEYDEHMCRYNGESFRGKGLRVFNFTEGATDDDFSVWYLYFIDGEIYRIYYVSKSEDKFVTAWTEGGDLGRAIEALAAETSPENPMFLAIDGEVIYAVIGETAYSLPGNVFVPRVTQMPLIDTRGFEITVITPADE